MPKQHSENSTGFFMLPPASQQSEQIGRQLSNSLCKYIPPQPIEAHQVRAITRKKWQCLMDSDIQSPETVSSSILRAVHSLIRKRTASS